MSFSTGINDVTLYGNIFPGYKAEKFELKASKSGTKYLAVTMSVARETPKNSEPGAKKSYDYIQCMAFGSVAEYIARYINPRDLAILKGRINTSNYGGKFTQNVQIVSVYSLNKPAGYNNKPDEQTRAANTAQDPDYKDFLNSGDAVDPDDLPF